jgi:TolB protein
LLGVDVSNNNDDLTTSSNPQLVIINADGSNAKPLTSHPNSQDRSPSWSPDGKQVVYEAIHATNAFKQQLYVLNADGTGIKRISDGTVSDFGPVWSQ